jgi:hypothetical protein
VKGLSKTTSNDSRCSGRAPPKQRYTNLFSLFCLLRCVCKVCSVKYELLATVQKFLKCRMSLESFWGPWLILADLKSDPRLKISVQFWSLWPGFDTLRYPQTLTCSTLLTDTPCTTRSRLVQAVTLLTWIREVPGSDLGRITDYLDWTFRYLPQFLRDSTFT